MDLSKLPGKESTGAPSTPQPVPPSPMGEEAGAGYRPPETALPKELWVSGPEAFLYAIVALFFLWQAQGVFKHSDVTNTSAAGVSTTISYWDSWFAVNDGALLLMAVALGVEIVAMAVVRQRWAGWACVLLMAAAGLANVGAVVYLMPKLGLQIVPAIAACGAGYVCWATWEKLR